jgi:hypothetical protein
VVVDDEDVHSGLCLMVKQGLLAFGQRATRSSS